ncbi:MAG: NADH-ubiquinone oxidoreductase-F iron-sulfur binding region domain-containing protein [Clostridia bacterium]
MIDRIQVLRERGNGRIFCNLAAGCDENSIDAFLAKTQLDAIATGLKRLAAECNTTEIFVYAPDCMDISALAAALSDCQVTLKHGPASPVLREESALYSVIATGEIRSDPEWYALRCAYDSEGFDGRPTLIVDGETACFLAGSPRVTKLIRIGNAEPIEAAIGVSLEALLHKHGLSFEKGLLLGGNLGRFVAQEALAETLVTRDRLFDSIDLFTDSDCMADVIQALLTTSREQSCQQCVLCREGTYQLSAIFTAIINRTGTRDSLPLVEDISPLIASGALCSFGRNMVSPAMSGVSLYRKDLELHIVRKTCPAGKCVAFAKYVINPVKCTGCGDCVVACDYEAIEGKSGFIYVIDETICEKCDACRKACPEGAVLLNAPQVRTPVKPVRVGTFR